MNSGKTLALLTKNYMLRERGFKTILMKPDIDDRSLTISSRIGVEEKCISIQRYELPSEDILKSKQPRPDFVLIDESQFLSKEQVWDLAHLVDNWKIDVFCYGLKLDWRGEFFEGSKELMKISDDLIQIESLCKYNKGMPALFHIKLGGNKESVETGFEDLYETVSRKKWLEWWSLNDGNDINNK